MTSAAETRRPAAFDPNDPNVVLGPVPVTPPPRRVLASVVVQPSTAQDGAADDPDTDLTTRGLAPPRSGFPWGVVFWTAAAGLVTLGIGLSTVDLLTDLYARSGILGGVGLALAIAGLVAAGVILTREVFGLLRLKTVERLRERASAVVLNDDRAAGRAVVSELLALTRNTPAVASARRRVQFHLDDIIDGRDLVQLSERELMGVLDQEARRLIRNAAKRVSVVTAVSPRAAIDLVFVLVTALGLVRKLARLYGGRPGALGLVKLMRRVITHLAVTGGLSVSDGIVQQMIGQGLAAKVSARLGEGVVNGLLTARLGLAALEVTRPLPFSALKKPTLQDLAGGLLKSAERSDAAPNAASPRVVAAD